MKVEKANSIARAFLKEMNISNWNGTGEKPKYFDERIWECKLQNGIRLDISFQNDDVDGWYHCCELVNDDTNEMVEILSGYGIDSVLNLADTIMDLCKDFE